MLHLFHFVLGLCLDERLREGPKQSGKIEEFSFVELMTTIVAGAGLLVIAKIFMLLLATKGLWLL